MFFVLYTISLLGVPVAALASDRLPVCQQGSKLCFFDLAGRGQGKRLDEVEPFGKLEFRRSPLA
jgi:hypothetical protein